VILRIIKIIIIDPVIKMFVVNFIYGLTKRVIAIFFIESF